MATRSFFLSCITLILRNAVWGIEAEIGGLFAIECDRERPDADVPEAVEGAIEERTGDGSLEETVEDLE